MMNISVVKWHYPSLGYRLLISMVKDGEKQLLRNLLIKLIKLDVIFMTNNLKMTFNVGFRQIIKMNLGWIKIQNIINTKKLMNYKIVIIIINQTMI